MVVRVSLPPQVSPPEFVLSEEAPSRVAGATIVAVAVLAPTADDGLSLGPGAAELAEDIGIDLLDVLERAEAVGKTGEVTELPVTVPAGPDGLTRVLLVG